MKLEPGDVVLVRFPFTDQTSAKTRPALVLSTAGYNEEGQDVIVCGITSNLSNAAHSVLLEPADMKAGRLVTTSRVKADKLATLQKAIVRRKVGTVRSQVLDQVFKELFALFPSSTPRR